MVDVDEIERELSLCLAEGPPQEILAALCAELRALRACVEAADAMRRATDVHDRVPTSITSVYDHARAGAKLPRAT